MMITVTHFVIATIFISFLLAIGRGILKIADPSPEKGLEIGRFMERAALGFIRVVFPGVFVSLIAGFVAAGLVKLSNVVYFHRAISSDDLLNIMLLGMDVTLVSIYGLFLRRLLK